MSCTPLVEKIKRLCSFDSALVQRTRASTMVNGTWVIGAVKKRAPLGAAPRSPAARCVLLRLRSQSAVTLWGVRTRLAVKIRPCALCLEGAALQDTVSRARALPESPALTTRNEQRMRPQPGQSPPSCVGLPPYRTHPKPAPSSNIVAFAFACQAMNRYVRLLQASFFMFPHEDPPAGLRSPNRS